MQNEIKAAAMDRAGELTDFPKNSYHCSLCGDCKTRPCARADCPIPPLNSQAPVGCACGQPGAVGVMHRSSERCQVISMTSTSQKTMLTISEIEKLVDAHCPEAHSPHGSVIQRNAEERLAFRRGINAAVCALKGKV